MPALVFLLLSFWAFSCGEKPPLRLTTAQRDQVDTLYLRAINQGGLSAEMDSLCNSNQKANIQHLVDSMLQVRRKEEEDLRKRYAR
ncbi:MAG: hypothetical protein SFV55_03410 [Haliscomenobacter sp.]|uniref:hypothetical protein n=1 Tax=Haliscomenobacter sp. TaxID=2717303 RepID=UPI0029A337B2|nr:hypothetical protein [Haliscomenobacter sp.]MDX2067446.1 hypothetical protein [Haliscomenobacter sp.]